jgi:hypothetical protein
LETEGVPTVVPVDVVPDGSSGWSLIKAQDTNKKNPQRKESHFKFLMTIKDLLLKFHAGLPATPTDTLSTPSRKHLGNKRVKASLESWE